MAVRLHVAGKSDKGLVRSGNEDYLHLDDVNQVYAVCDGMGGHQAGEVASMTASHVLHEVFDRFSNELMSDQRLSLDRTLPGSGDLLVKAIRMANRAINQKSAADPDRAGMGTTIVAVAFESDIMSIAHVGDSRAYRLGARELEPLTGDHSWVAEMQREQQLSSEEAQSIIGKNVITRALGVRETVEVDYRIVKTTPGEIYILCSDGLCGYADDDEIFAVAEQYRKDIDKMADALVQMANDRGGSDNVTVVVLEVLENSGSPLPQMDVLTVTHETETALEAENQWVERFLEEPEPAEKKNETPGGGHGAGKKVAIVIAVVFVAIAVTIMVLSGGK